MLGISSFPPESCLHQIWMKILRSKGQECQTFQSHYGEKVKDSRTASWPSPTSSISEPELLPGIHLGQHSVRTSFPFPTSITSKVNTHAGALAGGSSLPPSWAPEALEHEAGLRTRSWPLDSPEVYMKFVPAVRKRGGRKENEMLQRRCETLSKRREGPARQPPAQRAPTRGVQPSDATAWPCCQQLGWAQTQLPWIHAAHWHHRIRHALE